MLCCVNWPPQPVLTYPQTENCGSTCRSYLILVVNIISEISSYVSCLFRAFCCASLLVLRWRYLWKTGCVDARRRRGRTRVAAQQKSVRFHAPFFHKSTLLSTDMQEKAKARLPELAPCGQREPGGGIHAT